MAGCGHAGRDVEPGDPPGPDAAQQSPPDAPPSKPIRVLTINLKTALPSDSTADQRATMVAQLIDNEQPDVVALQEITESSSLVNRAQFLGDATGYAWEWRKTHELVVGNEGIGVMTRGTIAWHDDRELSHTEFGALHRAVLGARVIVDGDAIELFATHLTVAGSTEDRADQAAEVLTFLRANHQAGVPVFLAGDLNAKPDELAMAMLRGDTSHDGVTGDLVDSWPAVSIADGFTIPSDAPDRRIDYIYTREATPTGCTIVLGEPQGGVRASDHLGVLCTFE